MESDTEQTHKRQKIRALAFPILAPIFLIGWALAKRDNPNKTPQPAQKKAATTTKPTRR